MPIAKIVKALGSVGVLGCFLVLFINLALLGGIVQILSIGIPYEIHCSVESPQVNITKWTAGDRTRTSFYSINATFRVDNQLYTLEDALMSEASLFELLEGSGDTNKKREVRVKISHSLFPEGTYYARTNSNYSLEHIYTGNAYQNCFMSHGDFYYSPPPGQDYAVVVLVSICFCVDMLIVLAFILFVRDSS